jgi:hypothetical protein
VRSPGHCSQTDIDVGIGKVKEASSITIALGSMSHRVVRIRGRVTDVRVRACFN